MFRTAHYTLDVNEAHTQTQPVTHPGVRRQPITAQHSTHVTSNEPIGSQQN